MYGLGYKAVQVLFWGFFLRGKMYQFSEYCILAQSAVFNPSLVNECNSLAKLLCHLTF